MPRQKVATCKYDNFKMLEKDNFKKTNHIQDKTQELKSLLKAQNNKQ